MAEEAALEAIGLCKRYGDRSAVSGVDLLYYRQFKNAVLALTGEMFADESVDGSPDQQRAWLDLLAQLIPSAGELHVTPASSFDSEQGRVFQFRVKRAGTQIAALDASSLLEYQDFQGVVAHQSGLLYRLPEVEAVDDHGQRQREWERRLRSIVSRPDPSEAIAESWPWR